MNVCLLNHICCGSTWFISSVYSGRVYICIITYVYVMIVCQCKIKRYGLAFILLFFFFQDQPAMAAHCFKEGMKVEAVDPAAPISIRPATVTKVTDFFYQLSFYYRGFFFSSYSLAAADAFLPTMTNSPCWE